jgi:hypothetical protein
MQKSGQERLMMGFSMFETALLLVKASFPQDSTATEKRVLLFERLYKNDFSPNEFERIATYLKKNEK